MMSQPTARPFPCPRCGLPSFWLDNPSRPFCSERCKLIDLGAWASEDYRIATPETASPPHPEDEYED